MNQKFICSAIAALISATALNAQDDSEFSITTSAAFESAYFFRGAQLAEGTFMPSVDVGYGIFNAGVWAALPVDTAVANEYDYYAGVSLPFGESISINFGATIYTYSNSSVPGGVDSDDTQEFYVGISTDWTLGPSFTIYRDIEIDVTTFEFSVGDSAPLNEKLSFDYGGNLGLVATSQSYDSDVFYGSVYAGLGYAMSEYVSISAYVRMNLANEDYQFIDGDGDVHVDNEGVVGGFAVTASF